MIKIKSYELKKNFEGFKANMKHEVHSLKASFMFISNGNSNFRNDPKTGLTKIRGRFPLIDYNCILIGSGNRSQSLKKEKGIEKHLYQNRR